MPRPSSAGGAAKRRRRWPMDRSDSEGPLDSRELVALRRCLRAVVAAGPAGGECLGGSDFGCVACASSPDAAAAALAAYCRHSAQARALFDAACGQEVLQAAMAGPHEGMVVAALQVTAALGSSADGVRMLQSGAEGVPVALLQALRGGSGQGAGGAEAEPVAVAAGSSLLEEVLRRCGPPFSPRVREAALRSLATVLAAGGTTRLGSLGPAAAQAGMAATGASGPGGASPGMSAAGAALLAALLRQTEACAEAGERGAGERGAKDGNPLAQRVLSHVDELASVAGPGDASLLEVLAALCREPAGRRLLARSSLLGRRLLDAVAQVAAPSGGGRAWVAPKGWAGLLEALQLLCAGPLGLDTLGTEAAAEAGGAAEHALHRLGEAADCLLTAADDHGRGGKARRSAAVRLLAAVGLPALLPRAQLPAVGLWLQRLNALGEGSAAAEALRGWAVLWRSLDRDVDTSSSGVDPPSTGPPLAEDTGASGGALAEELLGSLRLLRRGLASACAKETEAALDAVRCLRPGALLAMQRLCARSPSSEAQDNGRCWRETLQALLSCAERQAGGGLSDKALLAAESALALPPSAAALFGSGGIAGSLRAVLGGALAEGGGPGGGGGGGGAAPAEVVAVGSELQLRLVAGLLAGVGEGRRWALAHGAVPAAAAALASSLGRLGGCGPGSPRACDDLAAHYGEEAVAGEALAVLARALGSGAALAGRRLGGAGGGEGAMDALGGALAEALHPGRGDALREGALAALAALLAGGPGCAAATLTGRELLRADSNAPEGTPLQAALRECLLSRDTALLRPALAVTAQYILLEASPHRPGWADWLHAPEWLPAALFSPATHGAAAAVAAALADAAPSDGGLGARAAEWLREAALWWQQETSEAAQREALLDIPDEDGAGGLPQELELECY
eukprot:jgi/Tetstr1/429331/TSEL_019249.t1